MHISHTKGGPVEKGGSGTDFRLLGKEVLNTGQGVFRKSAKNGCHFQFNAVLGDACAQSPRLPCSHGA